MLNILVSLSGLNTHYFTMPESVKDKTVFSLLEVTKSIQHTLADRYKSSYWIKAEMNKVNFYSHSGHCYPELVQKQDGKVIAQMKSSLWKDDYININSKFLNVLKEPLKDGIKILFLGRISFDPTYGLTLRILDIDPGYTMGDLEREKQDTIKRIRDEGIFEKNKSLQIPLLPQRIAIISVETSKGYADFIKVLETNSWSYTFFYFLFPALLQGEKAIGSIINQLRRIKKVKSHFDVVAIVRGGGGDIGLSCLNDYALAREIALFPIPVLTGIGHATNETVVEMISFSNAITPTKIAEYLIQQFHNFSVPVVKAEEKIIDKSRRLIMDERVKFQAEVKLFRSVTDHVLIRNKNDMERQVQSLVQQSYFLYRSQKEYLYLIRGEMAKEPIAFLKKKAVVLESFEKNVNNMDPKNVMKRGYSITLVNGKAAKGVEDIIEGDTLNTLVFEGTITSIVKSSKKLNEP
ncbi:MAG: exodeoxyribonuclease VII large subunit [Chitinophagaceae bacterium]